MLLATVSGEKNPLSLPLYMSPVTAGFPSPAEDYIEGSLDLNAYLVPHPAATFILRVVGDSMTGAGILPGDLLVVDRSVEPAKGHIVVAALEGDLTVKRLTGSKDRWVLVAEHPDFPPIRVGPDRDCILWGVVTGVVRRME
ncbi:MAG: peptidase S24 [Rhodospirillaceae bacterium]|nr:MAG: peptidase S24 [Rhodospirillaceae bacterium]